MTLYALSLHVASNRCKTSCRVVRLHELASITQSDKISHPANSSHLPFAILFGPDFADEILGHRGIMSALGST